MVIFDLTSVPAPFPPSSSGISEAHVWQDGGFLIRRGESPRCEGRHQRAEVCCCSVVHPRPALQRTGKLMFQLKNYSYRRVITTLLLGPNLGSNFEVFVSQQLLDIYKITFCTDTLPWMNCNNVVIL